MTRFQLPYADGGNSDFGTAIGLPPFVHLPHSLHLRPLSFHPLSLFPEFVLPFPRALTFYFLPSQFSPSPSPVSPSSAVTFFLPFPGIVALPPHIPFCLYRAPPLQPVVSPPVRSSLCPTSLLFLSTLQLHTCLSAVAGCLGGLLPPFTTFASSVVLLVVRWAGPPGHRELCSVGTRYRDLPPFPSDSFWPFCLFSLPRFHPHASLCIPSSHCVFLFYVVIPPTSVGVLLATPGVLHFASCTTAPLAISHGPLPAAPRCWTRLLRSLLRHVVLPRSFVSFLATLIAPVLVLHSLLHITCAAPHTLLLTSDTTRGPLL